MPGLGTTVKDIINGRMIDRDEAMKLINVDNEELRSAADEIRRKYGSGKFEFCSIINAKSGICSENCKFCAQSMWHDTDTATYDLLDISTIKKTAAICAEKSVRRFSIVTSGKRLGDSEIEKISRAVHEIKREVDIEICSSIGLINEKQYRRLKDAGVTRIHNNLETSRRFFPEICTTHTYDDKLEAIDTAKRCGFEICTGGIIGLGETIEDRIDLAFEVRQTGAVSMPVNVLNPIPGTPLYGRSILSEGEVEKTVSIFKIINPAIAIRMAGGRKLLHDKGRGCFLSGADAAITGDMLTTSGVAIDDDIRMVRELNYEI